MPHGIVLDTSIVVPHLRGTVDIAAKASADYDCFLPLIALGELYRGVLKSARREEGELKLDRFLRSVGLIQPDVNTAIHYARISDELRLRGSPLPENDVWIAATAAQYGMPLVTRDAHFSQIPGLQLLNW